jgi:hypothetical protein
MKNNSDKREEPKKLLPSDFYYNKDGRIVFTENYHISRGHCCGNGCLHCPYYPRYEKGNTTLIKK